MVRVNPHVCLVWAFATASVLPTGCALRMPAYPVHPASSYANRISHDAVDIAIHPITGASESKRYFGTNLVSRNVLAVLVVVDNHSSSSLVLDPTHCQLVGLPDRAGDEQLPGKGAGQAVGVLSVAAISPLLSVVAMKMMFDSENIKYNLHVKELARQTVSPGKSAQGFLYFRLPEGQSGKEAGTRWEVRIAVSRLGAAATSHVSLAFDWER